MARRAGARGTAAPKRLDAGRLQTRELRGHVRGDFGPELDAELSEQLHHAAELHRLLAALDLSREDVSYARSPCEVVQAQLLRFSGGADHESELLRRGNLNFHRGY